MDHEIGLTWETAKDPSGKELYYLDEISRFKLVQALHRKAARVHEGFDFLDDEPESPLFRIYSSRSFRGINLLLADPDQMERLIIKPSKGKVHIRTSNPVSEIHKLPLAMNLALSSKQYTECANQPEFNANNVALRHSLIHTAGKILNGSNHDWKQPRGDELLALLLLGLDNNRILQYFRDNEFDSLTYNLESMLRDWEIIRNIRHKTSVANGYSIVSFRPGTCYDFANEVNCGDDPRWHFPTDLELYPTEVSATPNIVLRTPANHFDINKPPQVTSLDWFAWYRDYLLQHIY